jgi:hypothetical protein
MQRADPHSKFHDLVAVILGAFGAGVLISTPWQVDTSGPYPFYKGPLIFPLLVLSLIILASLPSAYRLLKPLPQATWRLDGAGPPVKPAVMLGLMVAFVVGLIFVGLEVSTFCFLAASLYFLRHRSIGTLLGVPIVVTLLLYCIFKYFLDVFFPTPLLFEWLSG